MVAVLALLTLIAVTATVEAERGVGVNVGRIEVDEKLMPGGLYVLPSVGVINTGDVAAEYQMVITYAEGQFQHKPDAAWFDVRPQHFKLEPGTVKYVEVRLDLPSGADSGKYFAFLEAQLVSSGGSTAISAAAATRVYFEVKPSSWLAAQREQARRLLDDGEPWTFLVPGLVLAVLAVRSVARRFSVRIERRS